MSLSDRNDWTRPKALAIPKEGYFKLEQGKYGPVFPRTPACHGFTIIAKIKQGMEQVIREYGNTLEKALEADPSVLAPLKLHYLRWVLVPAFIKFVREHQCPSFLEYGEYPYVTADEIKKALRLKKAFSEMLDQMQ